MSSWRSPVTQAVYSSRQPAACTPPTSAPIDDPAMATMSKPRSTMTWSAPMWA